MQVSIINDDHDIKFSVRDAANQDITVFPLFSAAERIGKLPHDGLQKLLYHKNQIINREDYSERMRNHRIFLLWFGKYDIIVSNLRFEPLENLLSGRSPSRRSRVGANFIRKV